MAEEYKDTTPIYPTGAIATQGSYGNLGGMEYQQMPPQQLPPQQVVVVQPVATRQSHCGVGKHGIPLDEYQVGLCDCCHKPSNCLLAFCCPCMMGCEAVKKLEEHSCFPCMFGTYPLNIRFRTLVGIKESMCTEACTFCFCPCCASLRLVNEMEERDFHMHRC